MSDAYWIGVDLGGTKILAGLFDDSFKLVSRVKEPTPQTGGASAVFAAIDKAVQRTLTDASASAGVVRGLGIGIPGQLDPVKRSVKYAPNMGWRDVSIAEVTPSSWRWPVAIENDVRVGTYGEWTRGAAIGAKHVLGVFPGTGVGGALILDGKLYHGFNYNAGEIGHTIIQWRKGQTLESVAGRKAMMARGKDLLDDSTKRVRREWKGIDITTMKSSLIADLYGKNNTLIVQLVDDAARAIGVGIGSAINLLSPELVVIGGGLAGALGESFLERIWEVASKYALPGATDGVRCVPAALGDDAGIVGAAALAKARA